MNLQNPSRSSREQSQQPSRPFQNNQIQNEENESDQIQAQVHKLPDWGRFDLFRAEMEEEVDGHEMEEEIDEVPNGELPPEPVVNAGGDGDEINEFLQGDNDEEPFGNNVEILIPADDAIFDSSSFGAEEDDNPISFGERSGNPTSTADSEVNVLPEGTTSKLFDRDSLEVKNFEEEGTLGDLVEFEKELGEVQAWKELAGKEKIRVKDFLDGYNWKGKTTEFLRRSLNLALSIDLSSYGMKMKQGESREVYERKALRCFYEEFE